MIQAAYVLLTAAKNEEAHIGGAIASVLRQSVRPVAWFVIDDGSTDGTANIIQDFADQNPFIRLVRRKSAIQRDFGGQYRAIQAGYELARSLDFDFIGVQDADIAPESPEYYESLLAKFRDNPKLGIAGGYVYERYAGTWRSRIDNSEDSVAGGVQIFRRACFQEIGGYIPLSYGGSDWLAELDARLAGWEVRAFLQFPAFHYRPTSSACGKWRGFFRNGMQDAAFGMAAYFEALKCVRRIRSRPLLLCAAVRLAGFCWWKLTGRKTMIPPEKAAFLRQEQKKKFLTWMRFVGGQSAPRT
jgi:glycosyltransferase involved in cell wall biosynthesis